MRSKAWVGLIGVCGIIISGTISAASLLNNFEPGFYLGAQLGSSLANEDSKIIVDQNSLEIVLKLFGDNTSLEKYKFLLPDDTFISVGRGRQVERLLLGYSFTPYFSVEGGFGYDQKTGSLEANNFPLSKQDSSRSIATSYKLRSYAGDLMLKGVLSLERFYSSLSGLSCYAKVWGITG